MSKENGWKEEREFQKEYGFIEYKINFPGHEWQVSSDISQEDWESSRLVFSIPPKIKALIDDNRELKREVIRLKPTPVQTVMATPEFIEEKIREANGFNGLTKDDIANFNKPQEDAKLEALFDQYACAALTGLLVIDIKGDFGDLTIARMSFAQATECLKQRPKYLKTLMRS